MLGKVFTGKTQATMKIGDVLELASESYLVATEVFNSVRSLQETARYKNLTGFDRFRLLTFRPTLLSGRRSVGLLKVNRIEVAGLLRVMEDQLLVRFDGEYTRKTFPVTRFENMDEKLLLRGGDGQLAGIFHGRSGTFLKAPDSNEPKKKGTRCLGEATFRRGRLHPPDKDTRSNRWGDGERPKRTWNRIMETALRFFAR